MKKMVLCISIVMPVLLSASIDLESSYKKALEHEAKVNSHRYQTMAKNEEILQAKSKLQPKINLNTAATSRYYRLNNSDKTSRNEQFLSFSISAEVPVYRPENYNNIEQAELRYRFSTLLLEELKQDIALEVVDSYISILRAQNSLLVANSFLRANRVKYKQIEKMYERKLSSKMDLLSSKVTYEHSKIKLHTKKQNLRLAKFRFKNLTGIDDVNIPKIDFENVDISKLYILSDKEELFRSNIEARKQKLNIELTKKQIEKSSYGLYPKVDLSASATKFNSVNTYTDEDSDFKVVLSLRMPIYEGGYVASDVSKFRYLLSAANEDLRDTKREAKLSYEDFYIRLDSSKKSIDLHKSAIESTRLYLRAIEEGYRTGLRSLIEVEDARLRLYESQFELIDSIYEYIKSYVSLLNLFGQLDSKKLKQLDDILLQR